MTWTLKVPNLPSLPVQLNQPRIARVSGLIVDTPSSFASGPSSGADSRHTLIKACVDAFQSISISLSLPFSSRDTIPSKRHPRRRPRKAQRRNAASLWHSSLCRQNPKVRRGISRSPSFQSPFSSSLPRSSSSTTVTGNVFTTTSYTLTCTAKRSIPLLAYPRASWEAKQIQNSSSPPLQPSSILATLPSTASAKVNH